MVLAPVTVVGVHWVLGIRHATVFWVEAVAVWVFSAYWFVKGLELGRSGGDFLAASASASSDPNEVAAAGASAAGGAAGFNIMQPPVPAAPARPAGWSSKLMARPLYRIR
ncbi:MAG TPA: hypothetical protein VK324_16805 [Tepidisphaeraceae bacterium]|nr:hypothetical protein [Tepidisphaeraceae bacterium]